jgi:hypothetical protein
MAKSNTANGLSADAQKLHGEIKTQGWIDVPYGAHPAGLTELVEARILAIPPAIMFDLYGQWEVYQINKDVIWMYTGPHEKIGVFQPKNIATLRPCMLPLIGLEFSWVFAGVQDADMAFPDQTCWMTGRDHDAELTVEQRTKWVPDEDIQF